MLDTSNSSLSLQMINKSNLIISSVDWLEVQINKKLLEFDIAEVNNNISKCEILYKEIQGLLFKLKKEEDNMDSFMLKYRKLINDEKKALLHNIRKKK